MGGDILWKVWDGSGDPPGGPQEGLRLVGGPSRWSETEGEVHRKVRNKSRDPPRGLGLAEGPSRRSGTGRWTA